MTVEKDLCLLNQLKQIEPENNKFKALIRQAECWFDMHLPLEAKQPEESDEEWFSRYDGYRLGYIPIPPIAVFKKVKQHKLKCSVCYKAPKFLWNGFSVQGSTNFHCSDPLHTKIFHSIAPTTLYCCDEQYDPTNFYSWRDKSTWKKVPKDRYRVVIGSLI